MHKEIGETAGKIWRYLNGKGEITLNKLKTDTKENNRIFYMSIGWLAREDKIKFTRGQKKELKVSLK
jgi:hypothetical protein